MPLLSTVMSFRLVYLSDSDVLVWADVGRFICPRNIYCCQLGMLTSKNLSWNMQGRWRSLFLPYVIVAFIPPLHHFSLLGSWAFQANNSQRQRGKIWKYTNGRINLILAIKTHRWSNTSVWVIEISGHTN